MTISVLIVSYKSKEPLLACLKSLYANAGEFELQVIIVDNASGDGTAEAVQARFPQAKMIASAENLGFAKANNLAAKEARGEFVLVLNPDTEIFDDTLPKAVAFMKAQPHCGILGARMEYPSGEFQPSVRRLPTLWPVLLILLKVPKILPRLKAIDKYLAKDFNYDHRQPVEQVMGAFMFMPRNLLDTVGLFDDRFFIWFEEVDLCRRVRDAGLEIWYDPDVRIIHHGGYSFGQVAMMTNQKRFFSSAWLYFKKHGFR